MVKGVSTLGAALDRWLEKVQFSCYVLSGIAVAAMTAMITLDVILRSAFNISVGWLADIPVFLNIAMAFLSIAYVFRCQRLIVVDLLFDRFPPRVRLLCRLLTLVMAEGFFLVLLWKGFTVAANSYQLGNISYTSVKVPMFLPQAVVPLGAFLLACEGLAQLIKTAQELFGVGRTAG